MRITDFLPSTIWINLRAIRWKIGFNNPGPFVITLTLLLITLFSLLLRISPFLSGNTDILSNVGMDDPTYQLRRVEVGIANFPQFGWFDPMTFFPEGQPMHWGPLFPVISSTLCILFGAYSRPDIISLCLLIPCVMAAILVPIVFLITSRVADWKAGIIAGFFIAICPGQFFFRSYYGYFDHHIGEVLFSTIFCLFYIFALVNCREHPVIISEKKTWKVPIILGLLCGISYVIGLALMPTMILFALLIGIFTPIWFLIQKYQGDSCFCVLLINGTTFLIAIIGFFIIGVHGEGGLDYYTIGHPLAYGLIILVSFILFGISWFLRNHSFLNYILTLMIVAFFGFLLFAITFPDFFSYLLNNAHSFFGQDIHWTTIREARAWTVDDAWRTFQYSLILFVIGMGVLFYRLKKNLCSSHAFIIIWSVIILCATVQHIRYEYYLAIPVAILGGISLASGINTLQSWCCLHTFEKRSELKREERIKITKYTNQTPRTRSLKSCGGMVYFVVIFLLGILFTYNSLGVIFSLGPFNLDPDWRETMDWVSLNTPDPGVDYLKIYQKEEWKPPSGSYGIMSWWDYGHIITYLGKRIPNANPFQYGVAGDYGAARFFMTTNESEASGILDKLKTRYVITNYEMAVTIIGPIATWNNPDVGVIPYMRNFIIPNPNDPNTGLNYSFFMEPYYRTMVSRFHNFDGSLAKPDRVIYVEYLDPQNTHTENPIIVNGTDLSYDEGSALMRNFKETENLQYGVAMINNVYTSPVSEVPALQHYRLIHESPTRVSPQTLPDIRYIKVFEYVPGAIIVGEGTIEIQVRTNTGREFVYRQKSTSGKFTVPYPTKSTVGDIETLGSYRVGETGKEYTVTDQQVKTGAMIS